MSTRAALRHQSDALAELRRVAAERTGADVPELDRLARVRPVTVPWLVLGLFAVHLLLPQVGELHQTLDTLGRAQVGWLVAAVFMSAGTYVAAAVAQLGTVTTDLPWAGRSPRRWRRPSPTASRPPLGAIGISVRHLERSGLSRAEAVARIRQRHARRAPGPRAHAGRWRLRRRAEPAPERSPPRGVDRARRRGQRSGRRRVRARNDHRAQAPIRRSVRALREVLRRPVRAAELLGGSFAITAFYIGALLCALHAFVGGIGWTKAALAYLGGSAVGAASPTPGGLGAVEAALVAGLTALGPPPGPPSPVCWCSGTRPSGCRSPLAGSPSAGCAGAAPSDGPIRV